MELILRIVGDPYVGNLGNGFRGDRGHGKGVLMKYPKLQHDWEGRGQRLGG